MQVPGGGERRAGGRGGKRARRGEREQTSIGARNGERELTTQKRADGNHTSLTNVGSFITFFCLNIDYVEEFAIFMECKFSQGHDGPSLVVKGKKVSKAPISHKLGFSN